MSETVQDRDM